MAPAGQGPGLGTPLTAGAHGYYAQGMLALLSRLVRALPLPWAMALGRGFGLLWYYVVPVRRGVALANVRRAFGAGVSGRRARQIVRRSMVHASQYAIEGLRMPDLTAASSAACVERDGIERIDALLARGRGVVAVTAHVGNFDLLGTSQTVRGYPIYAILKDIRWRAGQAFWTQVREQTGLGRIAPRRSRGVIVEKLRDNNIVAFLIDQHVARHRAVVGSFFGQLAATTPAPVRFAVQTGAPILPLFIVRTALPGHHRIYFGHEFVLEHPHATEAENVWHNTERLNRLVEGWIRAYPEQWLWMHRRWKVHDNPVGWQVPAALAHLVGRAPGPAVNA